MTNDINDLDGLANLTFTLDRAAQQLLFAVLFVIGAHYTSYSRVEGVLIYDLSSSVTSGIYLTITPACYELRDSVTVQVIAADTYSMTLRLKQRKYSE